MKKKLTVLTIALTGILLFTASCKKSTGAGGPTTPGTVDTTGTLKDASAFPVGVGIQYNLMKNNATYSSLVKKEFDNVTFGYEMKHGAIVRNDGLMDFTRADELVNLVGGRNGNIWSHINLAPE